MTVSLEVDIETSRLERAVKFQKFFAILRKYLRLPNSDIKAVRYFVSLIVNEPYYVGKDEAKKYPIHHLGDVSMRYVVEKPTGFSTDYANLILDYLDTTGLEEKVRGLPPKAKQDFAQELRCIDPHIDVDTLPEWVGDFVGKIIGESAEKPVAIEEASQRIAKARAAVVPDLYRDALFAETAGICNFEGCGKSLIVVSSGREAVDFKVIYIDPNGDLASTSNMLACCHNCAVKYGDQPDETSMRNAQAVKEKLRQIRATEVFTENKEIEEDIAKIIRNLPLADDAELGREIKLPLRVKKKLPDQEDSLLARKIINYVETYYGYIEELFAAEDLKSSGMFEEFSDMVKATYKKAKRENIGNQEIFHGIVNWMCRKTDSKPEAGESVVSYFVQKCQVFDASTK